MEFVPSVTLSVTTVPLAAAQPVSAVTVNLPSVVRVVVEMLRKAPFVGSTML